MVKRIVQRYGGRLWVDSVAGEGSTFHLSFPLAADGSLGGYGGGLDRKRWLLQHERLHTAGLLTG